MRVQYASTLGARDRIALLLLRGGTRSDVPAAVGAAFARLRASAEGRGATFCQPGSSCVGTHELCLLRLLALHQRRQLDLIFEVERTISADLRVCAALLAANDLRLPHVTMAQLALTADPALLRNIRPAPRRRNDWRPTAPLMPSAPSGPLSQALARIGERRIVTKAELRHAGVTRDMLWELRRRGLLTPLPGRTYAIAADGD